MNAFSKKARTADSRDAIRRLKNGVHPNGRGCERN